MRSIVLKSQTNWVATTPKPLNGGVLVLNGANIQPETVKDNQMPFEAPHPEGLEDSFRQLSAAASRLNAVSDQLGEIIAKVETGLKAINLGVTAWVQVEECEDPGGDWVLRELGYDKLPKGWCIALSATTGNRSRPGEGDRTEWPFNEGPRWLKIKAIDYLPVLVVELNKKADELTKHLSEKLSDAAQVATALKAASQPSHAAVKK